LPHIKTQQNPKNPMIIQYTLRITGLNLLCNKPVEDTFTAYKYQFHSEFETIDEIQKMKRQAEKQFDFYTKLYCEYTINASKHFVANIQLDYTIGTDCSEYEKLFKFYGEGQKKQITFTNF
jgi:hypothetical protein